MPICSSATLTPDFVNAWIDEQKLVHRELYVVYRRIYWYCDIYSCVLVRRIKEWFAAAKPKIEDVWAQIVHDREHGYEHRLPKKVQRKDAGVAKCLMDLSKLDTEGV